MGGTEMTRLIVATLVVTGLDIMVLFAIPRLPIMLYAGAVLAVVAAGVYVVYRLALATFLAA